MKKKAVLLLAAGHQDEESTYMYYRLQEAGFDVRVYCKNPTQNKYQNDKGYWDSCVGKYGIPIKVDHSVIDYDLVDLVAVPGGWQCPEILRQDEDVLNLLRRMNEAKRMIIGICHAGWVLISAGILTRRLVSSYIGMKDDIINAGGFYSYDPVAVDDNLVTAPHYKNNPEFMRTAIEQYRLKNEVIH